MADVFLSYSRRDQEFVQRLFGALEVAGQDTWVDWEDIPLTTDWWAEIREGIEQAKAFIFVMTPESLSSPVCTFEVAHALKMHKRIIPVLPQMFDSVAALERLKNRALDPTLAAMAQGRTLADIAESNWRTLSAINWVQFADRDFEVVTRQLLQVLETDYEHTKTHTRLLQRALEWERGGKPNAVLLRGEALAEAEAWVRYNADKPPRPTDIHRSYVSASIRLRQRDNGRLRLTVGVLAVLLVLAVGAGALAINRSQAAQTESRARATQQSIAEANAAVAVANAATAEANLRAQWALQSLFLAAQTRSVLGSTGDITIALNLAIEALRHYDAGIFRPEAQEALVAALNHPLMQAAQQPFMADLRHADVSADGALYLLASPDGAALWSPAQSELTPLTDRIGLARSQSILDAKLIDDGRAAVFLTGTGSVRVSLTEDSPPQVVSLGRNYERIRLSVDGRWGWAMSQADDSTTEVRVWSTDGQSERARTGLRVLQDAHFSPDLRYLTIPLFDDRTLLWDIETDSDQMLTGASYTPVAWAGVDVALVRDVQGTLRAFRIAEGEPPTRLFFIGRVVSVAPSPDGTQVAVINADQTVRVLDVTDGGLVGEMLLTEANATGLLWHPDRTHLLVWGRESALLWRIGEDFPRSFTFLGGAFGQFTPTHAVLGSADAILTINLGGSDARSVAYPETPIVDVRWVEQTELLMVRAGTAPLRLWRVGRSSQPSVLEAQPVGSPRPTCDAARFDISDSAEFPTCSPNGSLMAAAFAERGQIWVYRPEANGTPPTRLSAPYEVAAMRFSPDNRRLAVVDTFFNRVQVYSLPDPTPIQYPAYADPSTLTWSEDGRTLSFFNPVTGQSERWLVTVPDLVALARAVRLRPLTEAERTEFYLSNP
jgi:WD40 repeat protein